MRKLLILFSALSLLSCQHSVKINGRSLTDTLEALRKQYDFKPLSQAEAYAFINQYYLPHLDSVPTGRKIFVHPLIGVDFKERYGKDKSRMEKLYAGDTLQKLILMPPLPYSLLLDKTFSWDSTKLLKTRVIAEMHDTSHNLRAWHRKYGFGYMCISYPQYNPNTKQLVIREWVEENYFCGTGRLGLFRFQKTRDGWKVD